MWLSTKISIRIKEQDVVRYESEDLQVKDKQVTEMRDQAALGHLLPAGWTKSIVNL